MSFTITGIGFNIQVYRVSSLSCSTWKNGNNSTVSQFHQDPNAANCFRLNSTLENVQDQLSSPIIDQVMNVLQEEKRNIFHIQTGPNSYDFTKFSISA